MSVAAPAATRTSKKNRHLFSADEYLHAWQAGVFAPDLRTELIDGEIVEMSAQGADHILAVTNGNEELRRVFDGAGFVRVQTTLRLGQRSVPEPDLTVIRGQARGAAAFPPIADILLVVEVSDWTLADDRTAKARLYAAAGIGEYWIVNLRERQVEVHRQPHGSRGSAAYSEVRVYSETEALMPLAAPNENAAIRITDLLPAPEDVRSR